MAVWAWHACILRCGERNGLNQHVFELTVRLCSVAQQATGNSPFICALRPQRAAFTKSWPTILQAASKAARDAQAGPRLRCLYDVCRRADGLAMQGQAGGKKRAHVLVMYVTVSNF